MLPATRVVVIDDEQKDLEGLAESLNRNGVACLPIRFTGGASDVPHCPDVRLVFADLHLLAGPPGEYARDFSTIGGLIEDRLRPTGPYLIVLWTRYPEEADGLYDYLNRGLEGVTKPFAVQPLRKDVHLAGDGSLRSTDALMEEIERVVGSQPQVGALLNWEDRMTEAVSESVASVMELAEPVSDSGSTAEEIGNLLANLAVAGVGEKHVEEDRFRAVNEALLPILADRVARMRSRDRDEALWRGAFDRDGTKARLPPRKAARLNRFFHIGEPSEGWERGAVIALAEEHCEQGFERTFGVPERALARDQFWEKELGRSDLAPRWVLVQTQAACDYAQSRPGPLPFHLGLIVRKSAVRSKRPPEALWMSPCFEFEGEEQFLHVNARFQLSLAHGRLEETEPLCRLREQLLNDLIFRLHSYGARPGIISLAV